MIKAVLFDYGGVLSSGGKNFRVSLAEMLGVKKDDLHIDDIREGLMSGTMSAEEFFTEVSKRQGKTVSARAFMEASGIMGRYGSVYELAKDLRAAGMQTGILSNMFQSTAELIKAEGYYDGFEPVVLSFEEGCAKPEKEIYTIAIKKVGCQPNEILFIDDQEVFLEPAREMGMHTIRAESEAQIVADTKGLLQRENGLKV